MNQMNLPLLISRTMEGTDLPELDETVNRLTNGLSAVGPTSGHHQ